MAFGPSDCDGLADLAFGLSAADEGVPDLAERVGVDSVVGGLEVLKALRQPVGLGKDLLSRSRQVRSPLERGLRSNRIPGHAALCKLPCSPDNSKASCFPVERQEA
jgi:hypothetical protein